MSLGCRAELFAEFAGLSLSGLERSLGVKQLLQLPAHPGHVQLRSFALLPQTLALFSQLCSRRSQLLTLLPALGLHLCSIRQQRFHTTHHRVHLILRHRLEG
ncbi:hypothetical protein JZ751_006759 [Albula glossodonta]|uniref:Uncharacterized protein n=1 Tax=Albula glossodonta TaxID=121402 RepID=A0A8T2PAA5_9TELE|nr:hypothetical protein JZ751_006759 [Albula glossodonta]